MIPFVITALFACIMYLLLTAGSGTIGFWSVSELIAGTGLGVLTGLVTRTFLCRKKDYRMLNPVRILMLMGYIIGPFFIEMAKANLDVAYRVLTMKIRPGIIRVQSNLRTDLGIFMLANSITLTPGTITVDIDEKTHDLYIHNINIGEGDEEKAAFKDVELFSLANIPAWIRRIAE